MKRARQCPYFRSTGINSRNFVSEDPQAEAKFQADLRAIRGKKSHKGKREREVARARHLQRAVCTAVYVAVEGLLPSGLPMFSFYCSTQGGIDPADPPPARGGTPPAGAGRTTSTGGDGDQRHDDDDKTDQDQDRPAKKRKLTHSELASGDGRARGNRDG